MLRRSGSPRLVAPALLGLLLGCGGTVPAPAIEPAPAAPIVTTDTVRVRDPELDQRVTRLEMQVLDKEGQVEELQTRLDEARLEVVRAMAKLQTLASRAEAASGMAEAELALQSLRASAGSQNPAEVASATELLQMSTAEFNKQNYGGALYLSTQAKNVAGRGKGRLTAVERSARGETSFAVPIKLRTEGRSNVRDGPGTRFAVLFTIEAGTLLTAYSYVEEWMRVRDDTGRTGWVFQGLVGRRQEPTTP